MRAPLNDRRIWVTGDASCGVDDCPGGIMYGPGVLIAGGRGASPYIPDAPEPCTTTDCALLPCDSVDCRGGCGCMEPDPEWLQGGPAAAAAPSALGECDWKNDDVPDTAVRKETPEASWKKEDDADALSGADGARPADAGGCGNSSVSVSWGDSGERVRDRLGECANVSPICEPDAARLEAASRSHCTASSSWGSPGPIPAAASPAPSDARAGGGALVWRSEERAGIERDTLRSSRRASVTDIACDPPVSCMWPVDTVRSLCAMSTDPSVSSGGHSTASAAASTAGSCMLRPKEKFEPCWRVPDRRRGPEDRPSESIARLSPPAAAVVGVQGTAGGDEVPSLVRGRPPEPASFREREAAGGAEVEVRWGRLAEAGELPQEAPRDPWSSAARFSKEAAKWPERLCGPSVGLLRSAPTCMHACGHPWPHHTHTCFQQIVAPLAGVCYASDHMHKPASPSGASQSIHIIAGPPRTRALCCTWEPSRRDTTASMHHCDVRARHCRSMCAGKSGRSAAQRVVKLADICST